ncbi:MAG: hypothetical protein IKB97_07035, partial [Bacteroidaceae bacterium]|nr:hypothetical protein [Bacteroidaceae bacterium]
EKRGLRIEFETKQKIFEESHLLLFQKVRNLTTLLYKIKQISKKITTNAIFFIPNFAEVEKVRIFATCFS